MLDMRSLGERSSNTTRVLIAGMFEPRHTQRENCDEDRRKTCIYKSRKEVPDQKKNHNFTTLILGFNLQNCKKTDFYCSTHPSPLQYFVVTGLTDYTTSWVSYSELFNNKKDLLGLGM